jgi:hypothetical protein
MNESSSKTYSIKEVCNKIGISEVYLRRMILEGKIPTTKHRVSENVWRHEIAESEVSKLQERRVTGVHHTRTDGRNKYTIYLNPQELTLVNQFIVDNKLGSNVVRSNNKHYVSKKMKKQTPVTK